MVQQVFIMFSISIVVFCLVQSLLCWNKAEIPCDHANRHADELQSRKAAVTNFDLFHRHDITRYSIDSSVFIADPYKAIHYCFDNGQNFIYTYFSIQSNACMFAKGVKGE